MNLMIKPVSGHCNLKCRYCFYMDGHTHNCAMQAQEARRLLQKALPHVAAGYPLVFQGGEPLLAGYDFFADVLSFLHDSGITSPVFVQTNGTLLDERFAVLFAQHQVLVGISLDGTQQTHQAYRSDYEQVMEGIHHLQRAGCDFNILTVVTDQLVRQLDDVWHFYRAERFDYQQYIPCMAAPNELYDRYLTNQAYGDFLCRLFDLWKADYTAGRYVYIRFFENILLLLAGYQPEECGANGICSPQLLVESTGDVYPCDFYVEERYRLGNLHNDSIQALEKRLRQTDFLSSSIPLPAECSACSYLHLCRGGCKRYRDSRGHFRYCEAYRRFFDHALSEMKKLLQNSFS